MPQRPDSSRGSSAFGGPLAATMTFTATLVVLTHRANKRARYTPTTQVSDRAVSAEA